jgi:hypothetical protein
MNRPERLAVDDKADVNERTHQAIAIPNPEFEVTSTEHL